MKLAVAVASESALPSAFVVFRGIEQSIEHAAHLGYDGVELALKDKAQINIKTVKTLLAKHSLEIPCISTGQVFADAGLNLTTEDSAIRNKCIDTLCDMCDVASEFSAMVNIGRVRGFLPNDISMQPKAAERAAEAMQKVADYADSKCVKLILEPVNRYETNFLNSVKDVADYINKYNLKNIFIMPDVFHMNIEDRNISDSLIDNQKQIKYIHFADSNRLAPGWGHLDFASIVQALKQSNYNGWASIEILPKPSPIDAAQQAIQYVREVLRKEN